MIHHESVKAKSIKMKKLLIVAHTPSSNTQRIADALRIGAQSEILEESSFQLQHPLKTTPQMVLEADAIILSTTENLGYMSGAMKDFFDRIYYPCLEIKQGMPVAAVIRAKLDGTGTKNALESITAGLRWRWVQPAIILHGDWKNSFLDQCQTLSTTMAVSLDQGII